ncbi:hypothetical protein ONZ45_g12652 [Pleurotus djamor]|nr:hypothetical protein ONZ45_g12652 [Pleurotus djamor]
MPNYESMQTREVASLLIRLQDSPKDFESHLRRLNVAQIMNVFFGVELDEDDTHGFVRLNLDIMDVASPPGSMGAFLLNVFPDILHKPLSHWPTWLPGGSFMQVANKGYELCGKFLSFVDASGSAGAESFMHKYLSEATSETEKLAARAAAATSFSAGAETSTAVLLSTFLAMVLFPDVQKRAHEELDRVLQYGRLPTLEDRALNRLPYITAIYLECLRWAPPGSFGMICPLSFHAVTDVKTKGLPHLLTSNEIADGYTLPSGTIVMSNVWSILHDENIYASPMVFNPDRFIGENAQNDPRVHSFGYGKRSCPGRHLAESLLWLCIANILTVFDISPETDETGKPCFPVVDFTSGVMSRPLPFQCRILSRSQAYTDLIQRN